MPNADDRSEPSSTVDLNEEHMHWNLRETMSHSDCLALDIFLAPQHPRSDRHDEFLFIVIHQTSERRIKLRGEI